MKTLALAETLRKTRILSVGALPLKVILVRLLQPAKAERPMLVTPSGIVILVRLAQLAKAPSPMLVSLLFLPKVMLFRLVQGLKA